MVQNLPPCPDNKFWRKMIEARRSLLALVSLGLLMGRLNGAESSEEPFSRTVLGPLYVEAILSVLSLGCAYGIGADGKEAADSPYLVGNLVLCLMLLAAAAESSSFPYTLVVMPLFLYLVVDVVMAIHACWVWRNGLHDTHTFNCERHMPNLPDYLKRLPLKKEDFRRCVVVAFEAGLALTVLLIGCKLDGGDLSWGDAFTPLSVVEMPLFCLCISQWLIKDCIYKWYDSVLPVGFTTRVNWLLPPLAIFQFLLMAQLDHRTQSGELEFAWGTVFAPAFVFLIWCFLAATMCHSCCREDVSKEESETRALSPARGATEEHEDEVGFRASEDDVQLDVVEEGKGLGQEEPTKEPSNLN